LAAILIIVLLLTTVVSFVVPQSDLSDISLHDEWAATNPEFARIAELTQADRVFRSVWFYTASLLLALSLTACTIDRISRRRHRRAGLPTRHHDTDAVFTVPETPEEVVLRASKVLPGMTPGLASPSGLGAQFESGLLGFAGSVLMHLALVGILAGGVGSGLTRFGGELVLTEGQDIVDGPGAYLSVGEVPRIGSAFGDFTIGLQGMEFEWQDDVIVDARADVRIAERGAVRSSTVEVNRPARVQGKSFLLSSTGHAVGLTVTGAGQVPDYSSYVNLGERLAEGDADTIEIGDYRIALLSKNDSSVGLTDPVMRRFELIDPVVWVNVVNLSTGAGSEPVAIKVGQSAEVGGLQVGIEDVRLWTRFLVRADKGLLVLYVAFPLAILGTVVRLIDPDTRVRLFVTANEDGGSAVSLRGASRFGSRRGELLAERVRDALIDERS
jgi:cytochrome c biogenesis protein ResB